MTIQVNEVLIYKGEEMMMASEPLAYYRCDRHGVTFLMNSTACWRGYRGTWEIIEDRLYLIRIHGGDAFNERGEAMVTDMAAFREDRKALKQKLKEGLIAPREYQKTLKELKKNHTRKQELSVQTLFPGQERVFAEWFTGTLRVPQGEMLNIRMPFASLFEKDLFLEFKSGVLVKSWVVENRVE